MRVKFTIFQTLVYVGYDSHPDDEVVKITIFETSKLNEAKFDPFSMPKSIAGTYELCEIVNS